jgi:hypothetical protein
MWKKFEPKKDEMSKKYRIPYNEELCDLYRSLGRVTVRKIKSAENMTRMRGK